MLLILKFLWFISPKLPTNLLKVEKKNPKDNVDEYNNDDDKYHILFESSTETMTLKMNNLSGKLKSISQEKKR